MPGFSWNTLPWLQSSAQILFVFWATYVRFFAGEQATKREKYSFRCEYILCKANFLFKVKRIKVFWLTCDVFLSELKWIFWSEFMRLKRTMRTANIANIVSIKRIRSIFASIPFKVYKKLQFGEPYTVRALVRSVAKFIVPDWGEKVDSGLSYRPASPCSLAGRYENPMPLSTLYPQSGTKNLATGEWQISRAKKKSQKNYDLLIIK